MFPVVFPFFEGVDPPPTFPIPTLHTRLDLPHRVVLIAHSILSPRSVARRNAIVHVAPPTDSRRSSSPAARAPDRAAINHCRFSPEPEPVTTIQSTPASTSGYDTDSDLTSISGVSSNHITPDSTPTRGAPSKLKSKPKGEVGRPGRGGYTLSKAVHFDARTLGAIRERVHKLCEEFLDTSKSIKSQNANRLREVRDEAKRAFPALARYEGCWPVDDLVLLHLKNTSRRATLRAAA